MVELLAIVTGASGTGLIGTSVSTACIPAVSMFSLYGEVGNY